MTDSGLYIYHLFVIIINNDNNNYYYLFFRHLVEISGGLGDLAGKVWRVGLMGQNAQPEVVQKVLTAFEDSLENTAKSQLN